MNEGRRRFLKIVGMGAGGAVLARAGLASAGGAGGEKPGVSPVGMLIDTTACVGCRSCEVACSQKNKLPAPPDLKRNEEVFSEVRNTSTSAFTVVNRFKVDGKLQFVKKQCMHCIQPACAAACLVKAMLKTAEGPVIWREDRCMGCRYCMLSCPWNIPKFEYHSPIPSILKCNMCHDYVKEGRQPACVEACPAEAIVFARTDHLLELGRKRIYRRPDYYLRHIYGEKEVGGTSVLYLASVPFERLGFKTDVGETPYPEFTKGFLDADILVMILWPIFMLGLSQLRGRNAGEKR